MGIFNNDCSQFISKIHNSQLILTYPHGTCLIKYIAIDSSCGTLAYTRIWSCENCCIWLQYTPVGCLSLGFYYMRGLLISIGIRYPLVSNVIFNKYINKMYKLNKTYLDVSNVGKSKNLRRHFRSFQSMSLVCHDSIYNINIVTFGFSTYSNLICQQKK